MLVGIAILCFVYAPFLTLLRAPPTKEEKKVGGIDNVGMTPDIDVVTTTITNGSVVHQNDSNGVVTKF